MDRRNRKIVAQRLRDAIEISKRRADGELDDEDLRDLPAFTESSGNIFADLGFDEPEFELSRCLVVFDIRDAIDEMGMSLAAAATIVGLDEETLSEMLIGHLGDVTVQWLVGIRDTLSRK